MFYDNESKSGGWQLGDCRTNQRNTGRYYFAIICNFSFGPLTGITRDARFVKSADKNEIKMMGIGGNRFRPIGNSISPS